MGETETGGFEVNQEKQDADKLRTPNPACPACNQRRLHSSEERIQFHPLAGHGFTRELGWSHSALKSERK
jgi:hypothetical protein